MNIDINDIIKKVNRNENAKTGLLFLLLVTFALYYLISEITERSLPQSPAVIAEISNKIKLRQEALSNKKSLPVLWKSWDVIQYMSHVYGVKVVTIENSIVSKKINNNTWDGEFTGETFDVLLIAMYLQERLPIKYGFIKAGGGAAVLSFSLLGV